jgi:hypothetical protein
VRSCQKIGGKGGEKERREGGREEEKQMTKEKPVCLLNALWHFGCNFTCA